jgi:hypothetical protein
MSSCNRTVAASVAVLAFLGIFNSATLRAETAPSPIPQPTPSSTVRAEEPQTVPPRLVPPQVATSEPAEIPLVSVMPVVASASSSANGSVMNPEVSLDGLFSYSHFNRPDPVVFEGGHDPKISGFNLQQVELSFGSNVDTYFRADSHLVLTLEGIEIEEVFATTTSLPAGLQLKAGQFFTAFGRNNPTHPHAWDFANKPLVLGRVFGGDGLRNTGAQVSWLSPLPWYSEFIISAQNSVGEMVPSFRPSTEGQPDPFPMRSIRDSIALARWDNFFALSEAVSLNLGASLLNGANIQAENTRTAIYGGDIFFKYRRPESLSYVTLTFEALKRYYGNAAEEAGQDWGWYAAMDYRLNAPFDRWHLGLRLDQVSARANGAPATIVIPASGEDNDAGRRWRISPVVTFYPSEFSKIRFQYEYDKPELLSTAQHVATLQLEFLIGAHGAHKF